MARMLYVGVGGGSAIAAAMIHQATAPGQEASVAVVPGPAAGDRGLSPALLNRLSADLGVDVVALDPHGGAEGLAGQLTERTEAEAVAVVDVGGRRGALAGALTAAVSIMPLPSVVLVVGVGLEGERSPAVAAEPWATLRPEHASVLEWHPSESAGLLALAARGWRGRAERAGGATPCELTEATAHVHRLDAADPPPAPDPPTPPGRSAPGAKPPRLPFPQALARLDEYGQEATARGVDFLTMGRVAEVLGLGPQELPAFRRALAASGCPRYGGAAWSLLPSSRRLDGVAAR